MLLTLQNGLCSPKIITRERCVTYVQVPRPLLIFSSSCRFYSSTDILYSYLNHWAQGCCFNLLACQAPFSALDPPRKLIFSTPSASGLVHKLNPHFHTFPSSLTFTNGSAYCSFLRRCLLCHIAFIVLYFSYSFFPTLITIRNSMFVCSSVSTTRL